MYSALGGWAIAQKASGTEVPQWGPGAKARWVVWGTKSPRSWSSLQTLFTDVQSINQSKFIFQAMTKNYNTINVTELERVQTRSKFENFAYFACWFLTSMFCSGAKLHFGGGCSVLIVLYLTTVNYCRLSDEMCYTMLFLRDRLKEAVTEGLKRRC